MSMSDRLGLHAILPPPEGWSECPCGYPDLDERVTRGGRARHARWHLDWATGVPLSSRVTTNDDLLVVPVHATAPLAHVANRLAKLMQFECRYDLPLFSALGPRFPGARRRTRPVAYVPVWHRRGIGLLITDDARRWGWWHVHDDEGWIPFDQTEPTVKLAGIFICANYRRRGVARRLVQAVAELEGIAPEDFAWQAPLSEEGRGLALAIAGEDRLRVC